MLRITLLLGVCVSIAAASDVTGKWDFTAQPPNRDEIKAELVLRNDGDKLTGAIGTAQNSFNIQDAALSGGVLTFKLPVGDNVYMIKLTITGDTMKGTYTGPDGNTGPIVAKRSASAPAASPVTGQWKVVARSEDGREFNLDLKLAMNGGKIEGTLTGDQGSMPLQDARLEGSDLTFKLATNDGFYTVKVTRTGDKLSGSYASPTGQKGTVTGQR